MKDSFTESYEFPNGVNITVIPDVYITVAFYDDLECEVSHVLYFMTTDFQTRSDTVKALLIRKLLKVQFTSQFFTNICKYHNALVLYILLSSLQFVY